MKIVALFQFYRDQLIWPERPDWVIGKVIGSIPIFSTLKNERVAMKIVALFLYSKMRISFPKFRDQSVPIGHREGHRFDSDILHLKIKELQALKFAALFLTNKITNIPQLLLVIPGICQHKRVTFQDWKYRHYAEYLWK